MANEQNLIPQAHKLTVEEQSRAGKKSGEVRRRKRTFKELAELLLSMPIQDENTRDFLLSQGFKEEDLTNDLLEVFAMHQQAMQGNTKAFELIRDTTGEKPMDKLSIEEAPQIVLKRPEK